MSIRTRFAPSPTGYMHIGGLRTALYSYLYAKKNGGKFILRIEDTDQSRFVAGANELIYKTLKASGLYYDEGPDVGGDFGPYIQSERFKTGVYLELAKKLVSEGSAYYCFCAKERLDALREKDGAFKYDGHCKNLSKEQIEENLNKNLPYVIRQSVPENGTVSYTDQIFGEISIPASELDEGILIKSDKMPTYNFANVVDDHLMGISHVLRGSEYLSSTAKYNLLYDALGFEKPVYIHLPPVMRDKKNKLSKRDGDAGYDDFIKKGYLNEAIINYIALLGWSPATNREIFSLDELIQEFDIAKINKAPAIFDENKLKWMNAQYIRNMSDEEFIKIASPYFNELFGGKKFDIALITEILKPRLEILSEINSKMDFLVNFPDYDIELFNHKKMKTTPKTAKHCIAAALSSFEPVDFERNALHNYFIALAETLCYKSGQFLFSIRIGLTGKAVTPGGAIEAALLLGKDESIRRLSVSLEKLANV